MQVMTDDFSLRLERVSGGIEVTGDPESLECFRMTVELAGHSKDAGAPEMVLERLEDTGELGAPENGAGGLLRGYLVYPGTVALWLDCEVLNYL